MRRATFTLAFLLLTAGLAGCLDAGGPDRPDAADAPAQAGLSTVQHDTIVREVVWTESSVDGTRLRADVYKPEGEGPFPVILILSPYWALGVDHKTVREHPSWVIDYFAPRGYAVALGEMRGTRDSEGCWDFGGELDQQDGHDMVETLAAQSWSNGRVGMIGGSHVGMSQIAAAVKDPPSLKAIVPIVAVTDWYRYLHKDGAPYVTNRATPPAYFAVHASPSYDFTSPHWALQRARTACEDNVEHLLKAAELHGDKDAYWQERDLIARAENITAAVYLVSGLKDENVKMDHFLDFWNAIPENVTRKMWIGQFGHARPAYEEWRQDVHRWFDHFLLERENGITNDPVATVEDSTGRARTEADWPGAAMREVAWVPAGDALTRDADGDARDEATYVSWPGEDRDRLVEVDATRVAFGTGALDAPLHLAGEARLELEGTLDQPVGRWIGVLLDVAPDGTTDEISRAYLDARHRDGPARGEDVPPGEAQAYTLRFYPRDHVVAEGHEVRLVLEGGDMGCQGGGATDATTCEGTGIVPVDRVVQHTVHTGPGSGTRLVLPVLEDTGPERTLTPLDGMLDDPPE